MTWNLGLRDLIRRTGRGPNFVASYDKPELLKTYFNSVTHDFLFLLKEVYNQDSHKAFLIDRDGR